jgi:hypothetical protein
MPTMLKLTTATGNTIVIRCEHIVSLEDVTNRQHSNDDGTTLQAATCITFDGNEDGFIMVRETLGQILAKLRVAPTEV